ncbi:hypothetical protein H696_00466 [Fonticula alba]|uniref:Sugar phosphate transporter domain-containing protein n=1 Tax=Fonticula alba TaxID=691883 RepID=A0A058ZG17_FONAL|nr:hypothetical protein H696_00466 [Fonticula alba]KCV72896.1 hypothetical protein H696_00466 [Fonticula alba]|eukprot:XP_009492597.1 hypothetical protein H696_00466 [Fonticula alba]
MGFFNVSWRSALLTSLAIGINIALSVGLIMLNKWIFVHGRFGRSSLLTGLHVLGTALVSKGVVLLVLLGLYPVRGSKPSPRLTPPLSPLRPAPEVTSSWSTRMATRRRIVTLAAVLSTAGALGLQNLSLQLNPVTRYQIVKLAVAPTALVLSMLVKGPRAAWPGLPRALALAVVLGGVAHYHLAADLPAGPAAAAAAAQSVRAPAGVGILVALLAVFATAVQQIAYDAFLSMINEPRAEPMTPTMALSTPKVSGVDTTTRLTAAPAAPIPGPVRLYHAIGIPAALSLFLIGPVVEALTSGAGSVGFSSAFHGAVSLFMTGSISGGTPTSVLPLSSVSLSTWMGVLLSCAIACPMNLSAAWVLTRTSVLSFQVIGHFKTALIFVLGVLFFPARPDQPNPTSGEVVGICIALFGMAIYTWFGAVPPSRRSIQKLWLWLPRRTASAMAAMSATSSASRGGGLAPAPKGGFGVPGQDDDFPTDVGIRSAVPSPSMLPPSRPAVAAAGGPSPKVTLARGNKGTAAPGAERHSLLLELAAEKRLRLGESPSASSLAPDGLEEGGNVDDNLATSGSGNTVALDGPLSVTVDNTPLSSSSGLLLSGDSTAPALSLPAR